MIYTVTDSASNSSSITEQVIVEDTVAPVITLLGSNPQIIQVGTGYVELGATTNDGSPIIIDASEFSDSIGAYAIRYNSQDSSGNDAIQVTRTVEVIPKFVVLPPLDQSTANIVNYGRTVPIKFQLFDGQNNPMTSYSAILDDTSNHGNGCTVNPVMVTSTSSTSDSTNIFRVSDNQYILNYDTHRLVNTLCYDLYVKTNGITYGPIVLGFK